MFRDTPKNIISKYKEQLTTILVFLVCLFVYLVFPANNVFQKIISSITFLFIIPALYIKIVLKKKLVDYGVQKGDLHKGIFFMTLSVIISLLIFYFSLQYLNLGKLFNLSELVVKNFFFFIFYSVFLIGFFTLLYEFFFKGLVMFGFFKKTNYISILVQFLIFSIFLLIMSGIKWLTILYIIVSIFSGITAYQSRSLFYSFGATLIFIIMANALAINLLKK